MHQIKLKEDGIYPAKNLEITQDFVRLVLLFERYNFKKELIVLNNLRYARSNYLWALAKRNKGQKIGLGAYTRSLKNAKQQASNLYEDLIKRPSCNIFISPSIIQNYLKSECNCIS